MQWLSVCVLITVMYGGGGVTKTSGLKQFWTDDFKTFEKIYGKTNDKDIYGATLPPPRSYEGDLTKDASDNKERYYFDEQDDFTDLYKFGDSYKNSLARTKNPFNKHKTNKFKDYSNFKSKPISQSSDPENYNYLKRLEEVNRDQSYIGPKDRDGYTPYSDYSGSSLEDPDPFVSIRDILDAHIIKKNKGEVRDHKYPYPSSKKPTRGYSKPPAKGRCPTGRCRKRSSTIRVRTGPYVKSGNR